MKSKAQVKDSSFRKSTVKKTEIDLVYNQYFQDGHNSAVTGGSGTEKLTVYSPFFSIKHSAKNGTVQFKGGADVISSASTDNIDFVVSSASRRDMRTYANLNFGKVFLNERLQVNAGTGFSVESDYTSIPFELSAGLLSKNKMRTLNLTFQMYSDDLRWGRLNSDLRKPTKLIYPQELRNKEWFDTYKRKSYNVKLSIRQVINKRNILGIYPEISIQEGLLSTPFHRVYFNNGDLKVENLPDQRIKGIFGIQLNSFVGKKTILKNKLEYYTDDFGIRNLAFDHETSFKIRPVLILSPNFRLSFQKGSRYFAPKDQHSVSEMYYTSDYDLSDFQTTQVGLSGRFIAGKNLSRHFSWNDVKLAYAFYHRSNGLNAHILSLVFKGVRYNK